MRLVVCQLLVAALFSFKSAKGSWASASTRVNGAQWAKIGAQRLTFFINADGALQGTELVLRLPCPAPTAKSWNIPVRLNVKQWREVTIPLAEIKNAAGTPLLSRLNNVYLLQFVQRGTWDSRFFTVDQFKWKVTRAAGHRDFDFATTPKVTP
jgi:hypothetical protein